MTKKISSEVLIFAEILLRAVEIRESSCDPKAIDHKKFYNLSVAAACERAAAYVQKPAFGVPVELLLKTNYIEAITWANAITDPTAICEPTRYLCQHNANYGCPLCLANNARVGSK